MWVRLGRALGAVTLAWVTSGGCAPAPESPSDLLPCAMLRRQVCGPRGECSDLNATNACVQCKARLCQFIKDLETQQNHPWCVVEWRSRNEYPVCVGPAGLPAPVPPPFVDGVLCETECSLVPYPPKLPVP